MRAFIIERLSVIFWSSVVVEQGRKVVCGPTLVKGGAISECHFSRLVVVSFEECEAHIAVVSEGLQLESGEEVAGMVFGAKKSLF